MSDGDVSRTDSPHGLGQRVEVGVAGRPADEVAEQRSVRPLSAVVGRDAGEVE